MFQKKLVSKIFIYKRVGGGGITILRRINEVKNICKGWDLNPYLQLRNLFVLPTVPWEQLEFLTNVREIIKKYGPTEI